MSRRKMNARHCIIFELAPLNNFKRKFVHSITLIPIEILYLVDIYQSKNDGKDQELIQSSTTPDPGYQWESDKFTIRHHKREPRGQPFPSM